MAHPYRRKEASVPRAFTSECMTAARASNIPLRKSISARLGDKIFEWAAIQWRDGPGVCQVEEVMSGVGDCGGTEL